MESKTIGNGLKGGRQILNNSVLMHIFVTLFRSLDKVRSSRTGPVEISFTYRSVLILLLSISTLVRSEQLFPES